MSGAGCVCVNGSFRAPEEATVSVLDAGFLLGDGLFESLRASGGVPYLLDRHLDRLAAGAGAVGFPPLPPRDVLAAEVEGTMRRGRLEEAYVRITISRGRAGIGLSAGDGEPTRVVAALPLPPAESEEPVAAISIPSSPARPLLGLKSTSWQFAVMARRRAADAGAGEGIYVSAGGHLSEGIASNLMAVADGELLTPPVSECLPGITRARIVELAAGAGIPTREEPLHRDRLLAADEALLTNAVQGVRVLGALDGVPISVGAPDGVGAELARLYERDRTAPRIRLGGGV